MTIADVLKLHGHNCSRRVLPTGRLLFETRQAPLEAVSAAMPLKPHTFHGGADREDSRDEAPWWLEPGVLDRDHEAMNRYFPAFIFDPGNPESPPAWVGPISTVMGTFQIAVLYRYDRGMPSVAPLNQGQHTRRAGRRTMRAPHMYDSGFLCVASDSDWDPQLDTVATVVGWAAHWYACYVEWVFTGKWPTEGFSGVAA